MIQKKTVLVFGTFDLLHKGHVFFLNQAKQHGDCLVVVVARDRNVEQLKGQAPQQNERHRLQQVQSLKCVDEARLGNEEWSQRLQVLGDLSPDIICLGYDQQAEIPAGVWKVVRLAAFKPEKYKSSKIKQNKKES